MGELLYGIDSSWITIILFASMAVALEVSYRVGRRRTAEYDANFRSHILGLQASILGILALLLGFTFSLALQRFESRSETGTEEVNAIRSTFTQSTLLPEPMRGEVRELLRQYVNLRVQSLQNTTVATVEQARLLPQTIGTHRALWGVTNRVIERDPNARGTLQFVASLNRLVESFHRRKAGLDRHVPEAVLWLLYLTFVMAGTAVGYASGVGGHRPAFVGWVMVALISVLVFIILDLDRPTRGLIRVSHQGMLLLQTAINAELR